MDESLTTDDFNDLMIKNSERTAKSIAPMGNFNAAKFSEQNLDA